MLSKTVRRLGIVVLSAVLFTTLAVSLFADASKFSASKDAREKDEPQKFLPDYDKLIEGKKADWVYFPEGVKLKSFKTVVLKDFTVTGHAKESKGAAEYGVEYLAQWIEKSDLGWSIEKKAGDIVIEGNVFNAWEPSDAAAFWGGGLGADPTVGVELIGRDKSGKILFEVRHKRKGSTMPDAVENALDNIVATLEKGK